MIDKLKELYNQLMNESQYIKAKVVSEVIEELEDME